MYIITVSRQQILRRVSFLLTLAILAVITATAGNRSLFTSAEAEAEKPLTRAPSTENLVALTFDVTYGEQELRKILDILESKGVKATFFVGGTFLALHPDAVKQISAKGHEVGTLGQQIKDISALPEQEVTRTLLESQSSLAKILGEQVRYFRPPQGPATPTVVRGARAAELITVTHSLDSQDHLRRTADQITRRVVRGARKGDIILLSASDWSPETSKALPAIIDGLSQRGFRMLLLPELVTEQRPVQP